MCSIGIVYTCLRVNQVKCVFYSNFNMGNNSFGDIKVEYR